MFDFFRLFQTRSFVLSSEHENINIATIGTLLGPLHMSPVDRAGSVTEMKLVSVHMVTFSPLSEMKNFEKVVTRPFRREI